MNPIPRALVIFFLTNAFLFLHTNLPAQQLAPAPDAKVVMMQLKVLGYWVDSSFSPKTPQNKQAIIAFQKIQRLPRTGKLSEKIIASIWCSVTPAAKDTMHRDHIEVDLNRQVLLVVDSVGKVNHILSVSTGNGKRFFYPDKGWEEARTPRGKFKVYYKISGWRKSKLGMLFDPLYISGGFAIHGAKEVPVVPASHGCIRIPIFAADELFRNTPIGTIVVIYGNNPKPS